MALPVRGTGLVTGRAGDRRGGQPRTDAERAVRHAANSGNSSVDGMTLVVLFGLTVITYMTWTWLQKRHRR